MARQQAGAMMLVETIEAAAIRLRSVTWSVPRPGRHHDVLAYILREQPWREHVGGTQGFVTSAGRFVGREEARKLAEAANQIIASCTDKEGVPYKREHRELFSEDVW